MSHNRNRLNVNDGLWKFFNACTCAQYYVFFEIYVATYLWSLHKSSYQTHQNHSLPKLGTENTPQCIKMPNLAWSNQAGIGLESSDSQVGWYCAPFGSTNNSSGKKNQEMTVKTSISNSETRQWTCRPIHWYCIILCDNDGFYTRISRDKNRSLVL